MDALEQGPLATTKATMDVFAAIYGRRSVRDYQAREPARELIAQVVNDAVQAPNSINRQAWSFVVVTGREVLSGLARDAKVHALANLPTGVEPDLHGFLANEGFDIFYGAPALIVICATLADPMVAEDCCLAAQTLMLAAHARGLGSCWIGFSEGWFRTAEGRKRLGLPEGHMPVAPIILGYARTTPPPTGRQTPKIAWVGGEP